LAREVQNRLFPTQRPSIPGLDYFCDWRPASTAGADYLDYFEMDEGNFGLAIGEVSAQGVEAAMLTSTLHSVVRAMRFSVGASVSDMMSAIDELFSDVCPD